MSLPQKQKNVSLINTNYLTIRLNIKYVEESQNLPYLYWNSKQCIKTHPNRVLNTWQSQQVGKSFLKLLLFFVYKGCLNMQRVTSNIVMSINCINTYFIVDAVRMLLTFWPLSRNYGGAKSVRAYDFSNLYKTIPDQKLQKSSDDLLTKFSYLSTSVITRHIVQTRLQI